MDTKHALKGMLLIAGLAVVGVTVLALYASLKAFPPLKTVFQRAGEHARAHTHKGLLS